jgi:hypothetical protein
MNTIYYCADVTDSNKSNSENNRKKCQGIHNSVCMILFHRIVPTIDRAQEIEFDENFVVHADHNKVPEWKQLHNTLSYRLIIHYHKKPSFINMIFKICLI